MKPPAKRIDTREEEWTTEGEFRARGVWDAHEAKKPTYKKPNDTHQRYDEGILAPFYEVHQGRQSLRMALSATFLGEYGHTKLDLQ